MHKSYALETLGGHTPTMPRMSLPSY